METEQTLDFILDLFFEKQFTMILSVEGITLIYKKIIF